MTQRTWKCCSSNSCTKLLHRLIYLNFSRVPHVIDRCIQRTQENRWSIFTGGTKTWWLGQQKVWYKIQVACGKNDCGASGEKMTICHWAKSSFSCYGLGVIAILRRWLQWCATSLLDTTTFTERKSTSSASQTQPDIYLRIPEQSVQRRIHWMIFPQNFSS